MVAQRTSSNGMPVMAQEGSDLVSGTVGMSMRLTRVGQMKLASDPESRSTGTWTWFPSQETLAVIAGWEAEGGELVVMPIRIPSLTDGRCLLTDRLTVDVPPHRSTDKGGSPGVVVALKAKSSYAPLA